MAQPLFTLLQTRHESLDPAVVREILMHEAGMPKADAARASQKARGILAERLTADQAKHAAAAFLARGCGVTALPQEKLASTGRALSAAWARVDEDALVIPSDYRGGESRIPWPSVFVVSSGLVQCVKEQRTAVESFPDDDRSSGITVTDWRVERKTEQQHITEILGFSDAAKMLHFRLHADRLHAPLVPLGGPSASRFEKYLLLVDEIVRHASQAEISPETRQILAERRQVPREVKGKKPYVFDERGFDTYNRWLLALVMRQERGEGG
jgi:hypothetical protein